MKTWKGIQEGTQRKKDRNKYMKEYINEEHHRGTGGAKRQKGRAK